MQTIILNAETLAQLRTGSVNGVSSEMVNYIEEKEAHSVTINPKGFMSEGYVSIDYKNGDSELCELDQTVFDYTTL